MTVIHITKKKESIAQFIVVFFLPGDESQVTLQFLFDSPRKSAKNRRKIFQGISFLREPDKDLHESLPKRKNIGDARVDHPNIDLILDL